MEITGDLQTLLGCWQGKWRTSKINEHLYSDNINFYLGTTHTGKHNIQGVTGPHRQNDRPCREDHFL